MLLMELEITEALWFKMFDVLNYSKKAISFKYFEGRLFISHGNPQGTINNVKFLADYIDKHPEENIKILCCHPTLVKDGIKDKYPQVASRILFDSKYPLRIDWIDWIGDYRNKLGLVQISEHI